MRKITQDAATASHKLVPFSRGNTKVVVYRDNVPTDTGANAEPSMGRRSDICVWILKGV